MVSTFKRIIMLAVSIIILWRGLSSVIAAIVVIVLNLRIAGLLRTPLMILSFIGRLHRYNCFPFHQIFVDLDCREEQGEMRFSWISLPSSLSPSCELG